MQEDKGRKLEVHRKSITYWIRLLCSRVTQILLRTIDRRRQYRKKSKVEDSDLQTVALVGAKRTQLRLIESVLRCFAARDLDAFSLYSVMEE